MKRHQWSLAYCQDNLSQIPASERHFATLTVSIDEDRLPEARQLIRQCMAQIAELGDTHSRNRVYELDVLLSDRD